MTTPPDWGALFQQHHAAMHRAATYILYPRGHQDLTDDAVMQAILTLIAHPPPDIDNPEALLVATAKRKAIDIIRSFEIARRADRPLEDDDLQGADVGPAAVDRIDQQRLMQALHAEIAQLPRLQQQVIQKVVIEDCSTTQVAVELGLSKARISQLKKVALLVLHDRLKERTAR